MPKTIYTNQYRTFCQYLTVRRKALGLTQQELADRLKKPQSFVAKFELGDRRLDVIEFLAVARALEIDPCEVIRQIEPIPSGEQTEEPPT